MPIQMNAKKAAAMLYAASVQKKALEALPDDCRPDSPTDAYAIQDLFVGHLGKPVGYKIAFTNPAIQKSLGIDEPASGRLIAGRVLPSPATIDGRKLFRVGIEAEFAFVIGRDLAPTAAPFTREQVADAVAGVLPAVEVVDTRFKDWATCGVAQAIADNALGSHWVYGPTIADWRQLDLPRREAITSVNGREVSRGTGANVLGDPLTALVWLANDLPSRSLGLAKGDYVTTGSCTPIVMAKPGDRVAVSFGDLGEITVNL